MTPSSLLGMAIFPTFTAMMAKRDCVSWFILAVKREKYYSKK
jgi:hypothetical protein